MSLALELAQSLLIPNGLAPLPVIAHTKRAAVPWAKWQAEGIAATQLPMLFRDESLTVAAICGAASGNLLALDCDSERAFDNMRAALNDPETWQVQSQRGGHIYFRTDVPVRTRKPRTDVQILAQGNYVMSPGALHPSGIHYQFIKQTPHIATLTSLTAIPGITLEPVSIRPVGMPRLAWRILTGQNVRREYASDSEKEFAAICSMVNAGMSFERIHAAFVSLANHSKTHFGRWMTERGGQRQARAMLERMYRDALSFTSHDSVERQTAKILRAHLLDHPLDGRTGTYDTCVLDALLQIALQAGTLTIAASARDIAERAGISKEAANKATHRLQARGWLILDTEWCGRFANVYRIQAKPEFGLQNLYTSSKALNVRECIGFATSENLFAGNGFFADDAFRWQGLGKTAALVCAQLQHTPMTLDELAGKLGRDKSTISRALEKLRAANVVETADLRGWAICWRISPNLDLKQVAREMSTDGIAQRQKRDHIAERDKYRRRLTEWQSEHEPETSH